MTSSRARLSQGATEPAAAARKAGPAYAKLYLRGLADDPSLTAGEKLALAVLLNHQRMSGGGWTILSYGRWAEEVGRHPKHLKRVVRLLNRRFNAGDTGWKVLVRHRKFGCQQKANAMRVKIPAEVSQEWRTAAGRGDADETGRFDAVENSPHPGAQALPPSGAPALPPLGARALPIKEPLKRTSLQDAPDLFDDEPAAVNLMAAAAGGDPVVALARLVEVGLVMFVQWEGRWRVLNHARAAGSEVRMFLASETEVDAFDEATVHLRQIGSMRFGR